LGTLRLPTIECPRRHREEQAQARPGQNQCQQGQGKDHEPGYEHFLVNESRLGADMGSQSLCAGCLMWSGDSEVNHYQGDRKDQGREPWKGWLIKRWSLGGMAGDWGSGWGPMSTQTTCRGFQQWWRARGGWVVSALHRVQWLALDGCALMVKVGGGQ